MTGGESSPCIFFFNMYISNTQTQLLAYIYPCAEYNCFGIEYSRCLYFFCHLLWGCFIRLLENDWCCQKPCKNQLIVDKMVECVLMSVGSLGPADSKFIFLNIRKRRSKICNFYDTWKRRVEILCFSKCLEKKWGLHTPRSLPINLNMKSTSCWQHWLCTVGWGVFSMYFFSICISQIHKRSC